MHYIIAKYVIGVYHHHSNSSLVTMAINKMSNGRTMNSTRAVEPPDRERRREGGEREGGGSEGVSIHTCTLSYDNMFLQQTMVYMYIR